MNDMSESLSTFFFHKVSRYVVGSSLVTQMTRGNEEPSGFWVISSTMVWNMILMLEVFKFLPRHLMNGLGQMMMA